MSAVDGRRRSIWNAAPVGRRVRAGLRVLVLAEAAPLLLPFPTIPEGEVGEAALNKRCGPSSHISARPLAFASRRLGGREQVAQRLVLLRVIFGSAFKCDTLWRYGACMCDNCPPLHSNSFSSSISLGTSKPAAETKEASQPEAALRERSSYQPVQRLQLSILIKVCTCVCVCIWFVGHFACYLFQVQ